MRAQPLDFDAIAHLKDKTGLVSTGNSTLGWALHDMPLIGLVEFFVHFRKGRSPKFRQKCRRLLFRDF